jgi:hypothetical protein
MNLAVCTLFEGHHQYGVGALANSLHAQGFRGVIYVGTRGEIPKWASSGSDFGPIRSADSSAESGRLASAVIPIHRFSPTEGLEIVFLKIETERHFANYKPDLMEWILSGPCAQHDGLFYFDPDIVVTDRWSFYEDWIRCGVCVCEDVNSPVPHNHPRRVAWRRHLEPKGFVLSGGSDYYANSGYLGLSAKHQSFLGLWQMIQEAIASEIGGLNRSLFKHNAMAPEKLHYSYPFSRCDQDAFNAALEAYDGEISFLGQEGMGFKPAHSAMLHAIGPHKPWSYPILKSIFQGRRVPDVYFGFWNNATYPLPIAGEVRCRMAIFAGQLSQLTSRLYGP